jgi:N,N'-diacetyllegionaminate synthase
MIIAEIGWNFLGNLILAKEMILSAKKSGCKHVKFQLWDPKNLKKGSWDNDGRREIYNKSFLTNKKYKDLSDFCKLNKIKCFASVFSDYDYKRLLNIDNSIIKIPSVEAYNLNLIEKSLNDFKLVIVSTGAMKKEELDNLQKFSNCKNLIVMHCVSSYPLNYKNFNSEKYFYLKSKFKKVGYSGHCMGVEDAIFALSNEAVAVEKHFTTSNELEGRDNKFAILPEQLKFICKYEKKVIDMKIKNGLNLQPNEVDVYQNYRGRFNK